MSTDATPELLDDWTAEAARELGLGDAGASAPIGLLLDVTRDVAHGVTRPAGPITTYLIGLAVANGMHADEAAARVRALVEARAAADEKEERR